MQFVVLVVVEERIVAVGERIVAAAEERIVVAVAYTVVVFVLVPSIVMPDFASFYISNGNKLKSVWVSY